MKKMGEMQLSSVTDSKKKKTILDQVIILRAQTQANSSGLHNFFFLFFFFCLRVMKSPGLSACQPVIQAAKFFIVTVSFLHPLFTVDCYELKGTILH